MVVVGCFSTAGVVRAAEDPNAAELYAQFGAATPPRSWDEAYALAAAFVAQLSADEKVRLTTGTGLALGPCGGNTGEIERLGFRYFCLQDGPVGMRGVDLVTVFPAGVTTAATWDRELMYYRGRALGIENRIKGSNVFLGPVAGPLGRAPTGGRNWESFGVDPYLQSKANLESVKGVQDERVIACIKHWVAYEQEHWRLPLEDLTIPAIIFKSISENVDERTLRELYEWPFLESIEAGVGSVMCSYNRVNQEYACESKTLLTDHLKGNASSGGMGFRGFVVTDWEASAGASLAAPAGVDMVMSGDAGAVGRAGAGLAASDGALRNGTRLDEMATRTIAAWYKMRQDAGFPDISFDSWDYNATVGVLLDRGYVGTVNYHVPADPPLHAALARRIAADGSVLLKNVGSALPLPDAVARLGVFGSDAGPIPGGPNSCGAFAECSAGTLAMGWGSGSGTFTTLVDPLQAITAKANSSGAVVTSVLNDFDYGQIAAKAGAQDVCLTFINARSGEGADSVEGNRGDRNNLTAWNDGDTLVKTVASNCANTIVVIHSVGPIILERFIEHENVTAVVLAGLPGQESGNALVDVLWGAVNPSGRLPYTIGRNASDYCCAVESAWSLEPQQNFTEGLLVDYRWFDANGIAPRFEFGFGLSYTTFTYSSELEISSPLPAGDVELLDTIFNVTTTVTNAGAVFGKEVPQLYVALPAAVQAPPRQLRGFAKVALDPGESASVVFAVTKRDVSVWGASGAWEAVRGTVGLYVGASSRDVRARGCVEIG